MLPQSCSAPESGVQVTLVWQNSLSFPAFCTSCSGREQSLGSRGSGTEWVLASVRVSSVLSSVFAQKVEGGLQHVV